MTDDIKNLCEQFGNILIFDFEDDGKIVFSKKCMIAIGNPKYVYILINLQEKIMLIVAARIKKIKRDQPRPEKVELDGYGNYVLNGCEIFLKRVAEIAEVSCVKPRRLMFSGQVVNAGVIGFDLHNSLRC